MRDFGQAASCLDMINLWRYTKNAVTKQDKNMDFDKYSVDAIDKQIYQTPNFRLLVKKVDDLADEIKRLMEQIKELKKEKSAAEREIFSLRNKHWDDVSKEVETLIVKELQLERHFNKEQIDRMMSKAKEGNRDYQSIYDSLSEISDVAYDVMLSWDKEEL